MEALPACVVVCTCCRCCCLFAVLILGVIISSDLSGIQYYALVEEDETIAPYCRVIIHNLDENSVEIGVSDAKIGGYGVDTGVSVSAGASLENVQDEISYNYGRTALHANLEQDQWSSRYLNAPTCSLEFKSNGRWKTQLIDGNTGNMLEMPEYCGGSNPGEFRDKGNSQGEEEIGDGGMHAMPLVVCIILWFLIRLVVGAFAFVLEAGRMGLGAVEDAFPKREEAKSLSTLFGPVKFVINIICCSFFIAPVQNMEFHELCPQLLLSFYSGVLQMAFAYGLGYMAFFGCCAIGAMVIESEGGLMCTGGCSACAGGVAVIAMVIGGLWYHIKKTWWALFFGIDIDLEWYFPEIDLAMKLNYFHLLTFFLFLADAFDSLLSCSLCCIGDKVAGAIENSA